MELQHYSIYHFSTKDWLEFLLFIVIKGLLISFLFYNAFYGFFIMIFFSFFDYKELRNKKLKDQKRKLSLQFLSLMEALVTSLSAGYSLETAFFEAKKDLLLLYEKTDFIIRELEIVQTGLGMNLSVEKLLLDFGNRSDIEDIRNFANVVVAAKRNGGNLIHIIQKTVNCISDKISVEEEIATMIAEKKLEQKIMMIMPYGMLFYLRLTNGNYLDPLYHNLIGIFLMTVFLICIYIADLWAKKIMEICV
ncbi:MAG: type II secretion system F family protein [Lachnospiraceae bacterium]